jgi:hypothetical protein
MKLRRHWLAILGFAVVVVICAGTPLASVYNRGTAESTLRLSERELELPAGQEQGDQENAPLTLHLLWRVETADQVGSATTDASSTRAAWITRSKLAQLDIPSGVRPNTFVSTYLVLELDRRAHARAVSRACNPASPSRDAPTCEFEIKRSSRLYVVDAGRTVAELRGRYPDRSHYAIVSGVIKLSQDLSAGEPEGYVSSLSVDTVQGMEPLRSAIDPTTGKMLWRRLLDGQFFDAVISFGRRLEPWNLSIEERDSEVISPVEMPREGQERGFSFSPQ